MAFGRLLAVLFSVARMNMAMGIYMDALSGLHRVFAAHASFFFFFSCLSSPAKEKERWMGMVSFVGGYSVLSPPEQ